MIPTKNLMPILAVMLLLTASCSRKVTQSGKASYYADKFQGRKTASGETFKQNRMTAAHQTLPFGTKVKVTNLDNGKTIKVRVNDRGPFVSGRIIDLSKKAARKLGMVQAGVANVKIKYKKKR
ncbi:septal ring lytic transglycosylase RlpA family protein [Chitinophaga sp. GCM10012297]|uniref:Probable endolytic peptidoglycan transglycosylase RlpA n=1 Tax=Chitinophaga chungangae TaxID=2821488 RepID=A0ABS3YDW2_9BACT|nr:septal ring lytic transglycosylase RlpA family protein [Chitinophaga chungangae]MBO9152851.1 septal ring lytic transglycosylase RlpA family protein [Chitinophaga chungangae]